MDERINIMFYAIIFLFFMNAILLFILLRLKIKYSNFIKTTGETNIEEILLKNEKQIFELEKFKKYFKKYENDIDLKLKKNISRVAIKKYNAFQGMGGELSAIICLLDDFGNGVLLNVVHTGELNHVFTKKIEKGESSKALSEEEKTVLASI